MTNNLRIVLGTQNAHKIHEMNLIAKPFNIEFIPAEDGFNPDETGNTFEENSLIKADAACRLGGGELFLADDSGLCVDFLDGAPGIKSARYADTTEHRIEKLLEAMKDAKNRNAHFECHLVLLDKNGNILHKTKGVCKGKIAFEKKGEGGFGYDPVFILDKLDKTMAELSEDEKNLHSHRGKALMDMLIWVKYKYCTPLSP